MLERGQPPKQSCRKTPLLIVSKFTYSGPKRVCQMKGKPKSIHDGIIQTPPIIPEVNLRTIAKHPPSIFADYIPVRNQGAQHGGAHVCLSRHIMQKPTIPKISNKLAL
ncbi:hypothetical protein Fmac_011237 [Flemingia macrophylla]|uniref:Uncharacterized protein n=1 Tax=Flemingia macrophylla TaxID=520843 RepID=A0ABD1MLW9_9FABA